jgi:crotonobetainyl-CoA:carnitine CoA-transferase CaiB-like acyl-CoA transferase
VREDIAESLQKAGVPAGEMLTALESIQKEHYLARGFLHEVDQPGVVGEKMAMDGPGFYGSRMAPVYIAKAPWVGEHTREVCRDLLGMDEAEIERLVAEQALEVTPPPAS